MRNRRDVTLGKRELLLMGILLAVGFLGLLLLRLLPPRGAQAQVRVDGQVVAEYPLSEDRTVTLSTGADGQGRNLLRIRDGRAEVLEASCPDGICVAHRPIFREGETIVCLPNRLIITIVGS